MQGYLRQSTASQARVIGPFIDDTDFKTAETALTVANTDVKLRANGTTLSNKNSGGGTHQANGMYSLTWDATDTANVGELAYSVVISGALQVFGTYVVLEEAVYDVLYASGATGPLQPTTAGRTLDVSAGGEAGLDWANIGAPTTVVALSGTTTKTLSDLTSTAQTELAAVPASTANLGDMIKWIFLVARNKITQTSTTQIVKANDSSTTVASSTVSDDGTTFTRGKYS
jgi:hypothetical protein